MSEIELAEAIANVTNWRTFNAENTLNGYTMSALFPNAFNIERSDLDALFANPQTTNIRVYLGYDQERPIPGPEGTFPARILLVGVDKEGKDLIAPEGPSGVYDHCMPCPSCCDGSSPLS